MRDGADEAALFAAGQALRAAGRWQEAIARLEAAHAVNPDRAETLLSLGVLRLQRGEFPAARRLVERALAASPRYAQAWDALGHVHAAMGRHEAAFDAFTQASRLQPAHLRFLMHRAEAALKCGQADTLQEIFRTDLAADPLAAGPLVGLGLLAIRERRIEAAIDHLEAAASLENAAPEPPMLLGIAYSLALQPARAAPALRLALQRDPGNSGIVNDLAVTLARLYRYQEAVELLTANLEKSGPSVLSLSNLATAQAALGEMHAAAAAAQAAMDLAPREVGPARAFCNLLPYQDDVSAPALLAALQRAAALPPPPPPPLPAHRVARDPARRLRIGLLSNLLRTHPAGWLTLAGLEALDREAFSIHCFGRFDRADPLANRFAAFAESWERIETMDDRQAAQCIRDARIDILIDLGGFGDTGRIDVCAHRPAPLQVKWVGMQYHSTGLPFIDYFLTDAKETPPGHEAFYTEKLLRLPDGYVCYLPPPHAPEIGRLPAERHGHITFGCLNNLMKITPATLRAWRQILRNVPGAKLLLRCPQFSDTGPRERIRNHFSAHGIETGRLLLSGRAAHREFLTTYNDIDIALDPFPYSGGLSTCEALYMGVPVLTRAGEIFAARHSVSHLANVGLQDWIAASEAAYVAKAIRHATDLPALAELRGHLRDRVTRSPLCDAPRFGKNLGAALRQIWVDYCHAAAR
jgi:predicted O-linked N-acetylglucosamine transferase (SPINDLY family)